MRSLDIIYRITIMCGVRQLLFCNAIQWKANLITFVFTDCSTSRNNIFALKGFLPAIIWNVNIANINSS